MEGLFQIVFNQLVHPLDISDRLLQKPSQSCVARYCIVQLLLVEHAVPIVVVVLKNVLNYLFQLYFIIVVEDVLFQDVVELVLSDLPIAVIVAELHEHLQFIVHIVVFESLQSYDQFFVVDGSRVVVIKDTSEGNISGLVVLLLGYCEDRGFIGGE